MRLDARMRRGATLQGAPGGTAGSGKAGAGAAVLPCLPQSGFFDMFATENRLLCIRSIERVGSVYESHGIPGMIKLKQ